MAKDPRADAKAKYAAALAEGTPADFAWGDLSEAERAEVQEAVAK